MTTDIFERCQSYTEARAAQAVGLYAYFTVFEGSDTTVARTSAGDVLMCGSNNYLGLTSDPRVRAAAQMAVEEFGSSRTGSRLLNGNTSLHEELERELADFLGMPSALLFPTGYQANLGVIASLLSRDDVVIIDREAHASVYDGCGLSPGRVRRFAHNDMEDLERRLANCPSDAGRLVVVDGVYSMAGDLCPLPETVRLCQKYGARLLVDDAHGLGVLAEGRGTSAHFGVTEQVDLITVTFSKSLASIGGAVLGPKHVIEYLRHHARSLIFSAAAPPASLAAAQAALRILRAEPWLCRQALENASFVHRELGALGYEPLPSETPIVCVPLDGVVPTLFTWHSLLERGVYVNAVIPPAASSRLRASFTAAHTPEQLKTAVAAFAAVRDLTPPDWSLEDWSPEDYVAEGAR
ncbi:aminotransferase class I/II-fold pyridoxal phosphate-dependent enzyme [Plantactinospora alkalitolerans]|uniref:aminotransferase class I/II-fold pyridoxal phosphate-dependent enzyme n=1 Tax=Plantactinospora alkalitolerans TaxID=2789879 RepID=UPI002B2188BE|nr:pyridoxal phosphate-dependent aminotransferase family protein [Plantactinospora alkalitolerans]